MLPRQPWSQSMLSSPMFQTLANWRLTVPPQI
jgi:hypothetical protein